MQKTVRVVALLALIIIAAGARLNAAEVLLVANGRPNAEIVIAPAPTRLVELAAEELRTYVQKMTGAELFVVTNVTDAVAVKLYVGPSAYTDRLGITNEGLEHGAYRLRSGPDYLVMLGHELEFEPPATYSLVNLVTGEDPEIDTTFQVTWDDGTLVFDFRCEDPDMENLFVTQDVWGGDSVAILLDTPFHAYYQMEINPEGTMAEADRQYGLINQKWKSLAKVDAERGEEYWRVVVRIPVVDEATGALDPNHNVVGNKPTRDAPWFLQVGRVRIRDFEKTAYGFTQTGRTYHDRQKFGRLVVE